MPTIYIKLKDNSETVYFQSIMGTYAHIAWVRTENPSSGVMHVIHTPDSTGETRAVLDKLKKELEFEEVVEDGQISTPDADRNEG
ncbi:MAG TPA: DUF4911 domain-containing protein [Thermodesulfobacteriota bacterium]|nr:DUF4911 domain-containing protein [Thermodesulfobacteriota bacterium]